MRARRLLVFSAAALVVGLSLAASAPATVRIEGMKFVPASITVQRGTTVTWNNKDMVPHTATAKGKFDSGNIAPDQSFSKKMDQPGQFEYICTYHPGMKGQVVVK